VNVAHPEVLPTTQYLDPSVATPVAVLVDHVVLLNSGQYVHVTPLGDVATPPALPITRNSCPVHLITSPDFEPQVVPLKPA